MNKRQRKKLHKQAGREWRRLNPGANDYDTATAAYAYSAKFCEPPLYDSVIAGWFWRGAGQREGGF